MTVSNNFSTAHSAAKHNLH